MILAPYARRKLSRPAPRLIRMRSSGILVAVCAYALALSAQPSLADRYPNLQRALQLTPEQWNRVGDEARAYQEYTNEKARRLAQLDAELRSEQLREVLDPLALGLRHVEAASICRESSDRLAALRDSMRRVMNADQRTRFDRLEAGKTTLPALSEGQNLLLIDTKVKDVVLAPGEPAAVSEGWRAGRSFGEFLPGCAVPGGLGFFFGAIIAGGGSFTQTDRYPNLARHLELTESQVVRIVEINQRHAASMGERQLEVNRLREDMAAEAAREIPDAAILGARAARLAQLCREGQAAQTAVRAEMPGVLSETQRARWQELERAVQLLPALGEAQEVNLSGRTPLQALPPLGLPTSGRALAWNIYTSPGQTFPGCETGAAAGRWFNTANAGPQAQSARPSVPSGLPE